MKTKIPCVRIPPSRPARATAVLRELKSLRQADDAKFLRRFFKTGPGEYGAGDRFLGIRVPVLRRLATRFPALDPSHLTRLLDSPWHEARLCALILMTRQYARGTEPARRKLYDFYLSKTPRINNWDLVDISCPHIIGRHLLERSRAPLRRLAESPHLWERRIAIVSTLAFIRKHQFADTLNLAALLLKDSEDLMHKAVGWMLREVGKRDATSLRTFLGRHAGQMPRTMLRYAIEHFDEHERAAWRHVPVRT